MIKKYYEQSIYFLAFSVCIETRFMSLLSFSIMSLHQFIDLLKVISISLLVLVVMNSRKGSDLAFILVIPSFDNFLI